MARRSSQSYLFIVARTTVLVLEPRANTCAQVELGCLLDTESTRSAPIEVMNRRISILFRRGGATSKDQSLRIACLLEGFALVPKNLLWPLSLLEGYSL